MPVERSTVARAALAAFLVILLAAAAVLAQDDDADALAEEEQTPRYRLGFEVKAHYRDSDSQAFPIPFLFDEVQLPPGQDQALMETVEAGTHVEVSVVTIEGLAQWRGDLAGRVKIDLIDRYDRNPTSEDREVDVDEAWLRYGREAEPAEVPGRRGAYVKLGKFGKFERQDDRHLESYGLMSTSFNRLEDVGLEVGLDLTRHVYLKASFTHGNPVFFRDPNALAGDNGTTVFNGSVPNPVSELKTGFPIFYDADVDSIDFEHPETGFGLGWRWSSPSGLVAFDLLAWGYERDLAQEADLHNTFYGGDLDLLRGPDHPENLFSLPITDERKEEVGLNLWIYAGNFTFFGQYVDSELAGLDRTGFEVEASYSFELPWVWTVAGRQLFPWIAPAVRFSELDPDFALGGFPAPSVVWDWEKIDVGLRFAILEEIGVTLEWQDNTFVRLGREESNDELLVTLHLAFDRTWPRL